MSRSAWPDLVFSHQHDAAVISRATQRGTLKRLGRGLYSGAIGSDNTALIRRFLWQIVGQSFPDCVVCDASAMDKDPVVGGALYIVHGKRRSLALPGLEIIPRPGPGSIMGDMALGEGVWMSSPARTLLDIFSRPQHHRDMDKLNDWFLLQQEKGVVTSLKQLMGQIKKVAVLAGREKSLPEVLAFLASRIENETGPARVMASAQTLPDISAVARTLGAALITQGAATRPELAEISGLSKPSVSAGISELQMLNLVRPLYMQTVMKGRAAKVYGIAKTAGWVLGADIGNYQALFVARSLDGKTLAQRRIDNQPFKQLIGSAANLLESLQRELHPYGPLYAATLALSQAIRPDNQLSGREGPSQAGLSPSDILSRFSLPPHISLRLENNVNCAVAAEVVNGSAKGLQDVIFLQIGTHIGAGIYAGGQLIRGVRGCAGEVADIPFPWSSSEQPIELMLERYLGYPDYLDRLNRNGGKMTERSLPLLLERAEAGEPAAVRAVQEYGRQVGYLAIGLVATLDPAMIVLGGPVGGHRLICAAVRKTVQALSAHTEVVISGFAANATAEGAVTLAQDLALRQLFGGAYASRITLAGVTR
jgi:predicted NBD/HSP70 family sugar kinase